MADDTVRVPIPDRAEVKAFLDDIKDHPDDFAPRLILADWLEEHDDPRGAFLRAHCYAAWSAAAPSIPAHAHWEEEAARVRRQHETVWLGRLREYLDGWQFYRGLLRVSISAGRLPPAPEERGLPLPESFLRGLRRSVQQMFQLMIGNTDSFAHDALLSLADSEMWAWVETVSLRDVDGHQVSGLLESPLLRTVHSLDLSSSPLGGIGVAGLASSPRVAHLRTLSLSGCTLGPEGFEVLARSPYLAGLEELHLGYNQAEDAGVIALAQSPHLRKLRVLSLEHNLIGSEGAESLADSPLLAGLRSLNISTNLIGEEGARALAGTRYLEHLGLMYFHDNPAGTEGRAILRRRFGERIIGIEEEEPGTVDEDDLELD